MRNSNGNSVSHMNSVHSYITYSEFILELKNILGIDTLPETEELVISFCHSQPKVKKMTISGAAMTSCRNCIADFCDGIGNFEKYGIKSDTSYERPKKGLFLDLYLYYQKYTHHDNAGN